MPQCTIDIPDKLDKKIRHYMIDNPTIKRKSEAIIKMLEEHNP